MSKPTIRQLLEGLGMLALLLLELEALLVGVLEEPVQE